jgi:hypothetical protein
MYVAFCASACLADECLESSESFGAIVGAMNLIITLSYALRPTAKLCLLHGQLDLIQWGTRGVIIVVVSTRVCIVLRKVASGSALNVNGHVNL